MIRKNLLKAATLGLCMSALITGASKTGIAFANELGAGSLPSYGGTTVSVNSDLYEKQKEIDLYLFGLSSEKNDKLAFDIIYTGVSDTYVEVGINPYSKENADSLYRIFGKELVKVVGHEDVILYTSPEEAMNISEPVAADNASSVVMDMGEDAPISDIATDMKLIDETDERDKRDYMVDDGRDIGIQIESIDEPGLDGIEIDAVISDTISQTGLVDDLTYDDNLETEGVLLNSTQADIVEVTSAKDIETDDKGLPAASIVVIVVGGLAIIGGTVASLLKKKSEIKDK